MQVLKWIWSATILGPEHWELTALGAMFAQNGGGIHLHRLCLFRPGKSNLWTTPQSLAATALKRLQQQPHLVRRLQELIVLYIDELGQCGSPLLLGLHLVLSKVRGNDLPFGGVFVFAAGDHYQTEPVDMAPPYTSWFMKCHFRVITLHELFRSRNDETLQTIINLARVPQLMPTSRAYIMQAIRQHCRHVAVDPAHGQWLQQHVRHIVPLVPDGATWLLAKKVAVEKAREAAYNAATTPKECFKSGDFIQKNSEWSPLRDKSYRDILDRESALLRRCRVFVGARVTVVQNTTTDGQEVLNGASGTVVAFCDTHVRVTFAMGVLFGWVARVQLTSATKGFPCAGSNSPSSWLWPRQSMTSKGPQSLSWPPTWTTTRTTSYGLEPCSSPC